MSLTVTLNPSVAISYPLDCLAMDTVNRVDRTAKTAGDKELNVTRMLTKAGQLLQQDLVVVNWVTLSFISYKNRAFLTNFSKSKGNEKLYCCFT